MNTNNEPVQCKALDQSLILRIQTFLAVNFRVNVLELSQ